MRVMTPLSDIIVATPTAIRSVTSRGAGLRTPGAVLGPVAGLPRTSLHSAACDDRRAWLFGLRSPSFLAPPLPRRHRIRTPQASPMLAGVGLRCDKRVRYHRANPSVSRPDSIPPSLVAADKGPTHRLSKIREATNPPVCDRANRPLKPCRSARHNGCPIRFDEMETARPPHANPETAAIVRGRLFVGRDCSRSTRDRANHCRLHRGDSAPSERRNCPIQPRPRMACQKGIRQGHRRL